MIFETHAHYDDAKFDTDREMLLAELPQRGISPVINAGSSIATTKTTLSLAQEYPFLYAAVGVHPSDVDDLNEGHVCMAQTADNAAKDSCGGRDRTGLLLG